MRARSAGFWATLLVVGTASLVVGGSASAVTVASFTPASGLAQTPADGSWCPGGTIAITGSGFMSDGPTASVSVSFNGKASPSVQVGSNVTVFAVVPTDATSGPISVTTAAGTATSPTPFTVNACPYTADPVSQVSVPVLSKVKPASGKVGSKVVILGTSLTGVFSVTFNGVKAKFVKDSPNQLTVTVPAKAKNGKISVSNPAGTGLTSVSFKVVKK